MEVTRIFDLLKYSLDKFNDPTVLAGKKKGKWVKYSCSRYIEIANKISCKFIEMGIEHGDKIASLTENRPEWNFIDIAVMQVGGVHVPLNPKMTDDVLTKILNEIQPKVIFVSNHLFYKMITSFLTLQKNKPEIISFNYIEQVKNLNDLIDSTDPKFMNQLEIMKNEVRTDDLAKILYTSGTTSSPKGVMLTHQNFISNFTADSQRLKIDSSYKRSLSFLPLFHVGEITMTFIYLYNGICTYYADQFQSPLDNFSEVKPHVLLTVVLILENIFKELNEKGLSQQLFTEKELEFALDIGKKYTLNPEINRSSQNELEIADRTVYSKWRQMLGGELKTYVCGASLVPEYQERLFLAAGISFHVAYGLTESAMLVSLADLDDHVTGTAGKPIDGVNVRVADDGEILCKGPVIMKGYYNEPEITANTLDNEGWLHTGDVGRLFQGKYLVITGRKNEIFKISNGEYISPELIEKKLNESHFINHSLVFHEHEKIKAIVNVNTEKVRYWLFSEKSIVMKDSIDLTNNKLVNSLIAKEILRYYNQNAVDYEKITSFIWLNDPWTSENGLLTASMKLRRSIIIDKYKFHLTDNEIVLD